MSKGLYSYNKLLTGSETTLPLKVSHMSWKYSPNTGHVTQQGRSCVGPDAASITNTCVPAATHSFIDQAIGAIEQSEQLEMSEYILGETIVQGKVFVCFLQHASQKEVVRVAGGQWACKAQHLNTGDHMFPS